VIGIYLTYVQIIGCKTPNSIAAGVFRINMLFQQDFL